MKTFYILALLGSDFLVQLIEPKSLKTSMVISTVHPLDLSNDNSTDLSKVSPYKSSY